ncbi:NADPH-dependent codeinone reductase-like protein [Melia azedarach]|uniref:NADPH-dependent codeinone reductase-like protein n=1 Tax=Melia azedarach TaxID=155640 RepID=A0ACC1XIA5_MELAZ|nr:NADPH-dependent codeinone reductase-like protein [Melia azedarach]
MPVIGLGSVASKPDEDALKFVVLEAIKPGYKHFNTALIYRNEKALGEAIAEAFRIGLVSSREGTHHHFQALTLIDLSLLEMNVYRSIKLEYLVLYLIHWPISAKLEDVEVLKPKTNLIPMDYKGVWEAMEECQRLDLTKSIGFSNFSSKKLETMLSIATIPPSIN